MNFDQLKELGVTANALAAQIKTAMEQCGQSVQGVSQAFVVAKVKELLRYRKEPLDFNQLKSALAATHTTFSVTGLSSAIDTLVSQKWIELVESESGGAHKWKYVGVPYPRVDPTGGAMLDMLSFIKSNHVVSYDSIIEHLNALGYKYTPAVPPYAKSAVEEHLDELIDMGWIEKADYVDGVNKSSVLVYQYITDLSGDLPDVTAQQAESLPVPYTDKRPIPNARYASDILAYIKSKSGAVSFENVHEYIRTVSRDMANVDHIEHALKELTHAGWLKAQYEDETMPSDNSAIAWEYVDMYDSKQYKDDQAISEHPSMLDTTDVQGGMTDNAYANKDSGHHKLKGAALDIYLKLIDYFNSNKGSAFNVNDLLRAIKLDEFNCSDVARLALSWLVTDCYVTYDIVTRKYTSYVEPKYSAVEFERNIALVRDLLLTHCGEYWSLNGIAGRVGIFPSVAAKCLDELKDEVIVRSNADTGCLEYYIPPKAPTVVDNANTNWSVKLNTNNDFDVIPSPVKPTISKELKDKLTGYILEFMRESDYVKTRGYTVDQVMTFLHLSLSNGMRTAVTDTLKEIVDKGQLEYVYSGCLYRLPKRTHSVLNVLTSQHNVDQLIGKRISVPVPLIDSIDNDYYFAVSSRILTMLSNKADRGCVVSYDIEDIANCIDMHKDYKPKLRLVLDRMVNENKLLFNTKCNGYRLISHPNLGESPFSNKGSTSLANCRDADTALMRIYDMTATGVVNIELVDGDSIISELVTAGMLTTVIGSKLHTITDKGIAYCKSKSVGTKAAKLQFGVYPTDHADIMFNVYAAMKSRDASHGWTVSDLAGACKAGGNNYAKSLVDAMLSSLVSAKYVNVKKSVIGTSFKYHVATYDNVLVAISEHKASTIDEIKTILPDNDDEWVYAAVFTLIKQGIVKANLSL